MLKIKRTGLENYLPGGEANMKLMVIGGPGAGKTRWSSGWPEPLYLDCEGGLASVADRNVPYVEIGGSDDMLQALRWLKTHPDAKRIGTVVVDTLDAFQRKVKDEWLQSNPNESAFSGYDAWGYLDAKMQMLMTRLLSLPHNVIVLVHYKDKTITEKQGSNTVEKHLYTLQLQGSSKDEVFNDFDLIGWMGTFWKPGEEGGRVQASGLTFKPTPEKPFLKDRLNITPDWLEISLDSDDLETNYTKLFSRFVERLDQLSEGEEYGEIEAVDDDGNPVAQAEPVGPMTGGAVAPQDPKDLPLDQLTKAELIEMGRSMDSIADEVKTSLLKAELIELIEKARNAEASSASEPEKAPEVPEEAPEEPTTPSTPVEESMSEPEAEKPAEEAPDAASEAEKAIKDELGGELVSETPPAETKKEEAPAPEPEPEPEHEQEAAKPAAADDEKTCAVCDKGLSGENPDYVKLAWIKYREPLCNEHYQERKKG